MHSSIIADLPAQTSFVVSKTGNTAGSLPSFTGELRQKRAVGTAHLRSSVSLPATGFVGNGMPQIWMTYGEIAGLLGCDEGQARTHAAIRSLDRKKSRDGLSRVKLDHYCMAFFFAKIRGADADLDRAILELREVHSELVRSTPLRATGP